MFAVYTRMKASCKGCQLARDTYTTCFGTVLAADFGYYYMSQNLGPEPTTNPMALTKRNRPPHAPFTTMRFALVRWSGKSRLVQGRRFGRRGSPEYDPTAPHSRGYG